MAAAHKEVKAFVEEYFTDEPNASINDCVRDALDLDIPVTPSIVSSIRTEFRIRLSRQPKLALVPAPVPVQVKPKFTPTWVTKWPDPQTEELESSRKIPATKDKSLIERRKYYDDVLQDNPGITVTKAMRKVKEKFGKSVDPMFAVQSLRIIRELHAGAAKPAKEPETKAPQRQKTLGETMPPDFFKQPAPAKTADTKEPPVSKEEPDEYAIIYRNTKGITNSLTSTKTGVHKALVQLSAEGVDTGDIRVYKRVKLKIKVEVDFGE